MYFRNAILLFYLIYGLFLSANSDDRVASIAYLKKYGYLSESKTEYTKSLIEQNYNDAVANFQTYSGLNRTGILNNSTIEMIFKPCCGNRDFNVGVRAKRYLLEGSKWKDFNLTYQIINLPYNMHKSTVYAIFKKAFNYWASVSALTFHRVNKNGKIKVGFFKNNHGDADPFDGPGGTLAHAYFPRFGGNVHFDLDENWTARTHRGTNLLQVATHEIGHALGLEHSTNRNALMAPFYHEYNKNFKLSADDIKAIQSIYGTKENPKYKKYKHKRNKKSFIKN